MHYLALFGMHFFPHVLLLSLFPPALPKDPFFICLRLFLEFGLFLIPSGAFVVDNLPTQNITSAYGLLPSFSPSPHSCPHLVRTICRPLPAPYPNPPTLHKGLCARFVFYSAAFLEQRPQRDEGSQRSRLWIWSPLVDMKNSGHALSEKVLW